MKLKANHILLALLLTETNGLSQTPGSGTASSQQPTTVSPLPQPGIPQASARIMNGPQYSPAQLDFGELWGGDVATKTFSLTTPAKGTVTLEFDRGGGNFWIAESREIFPSQGRNKNSPLGQIGTPGGGGVHRDTYISGTGLPGTEYHKWDLHAGTEIQFDIVFEPVSYLGVSTVNPTGLKSTALRLSGPGPPYPWSLLIPVRGVYNGPYRLKSPQSNPAPPGSAASPTRGKVTKSNQQSATSQPASPLTGPTKPGPANSGNQAAVSSMYKDALGRPTIQQGSAASGSGATPSGPGQSVSTTQGPQSAYGAVLGRSSASTPSATSSNAPPLGSQRASQSGTITSGAPSGVAINTLPGTASVAPRSLPNKPSDSGSGSTMVGDTSPFAPIYSPDKMDFGEVWDGDFSRQTLHLTANAYGWVQAEVRPPFRISEFRLMGEVKAGSKNPGGQKMNLVTQKIQRTFYKPDEQGPHQWNLEPGNQVEIDVLFEPKFEFGSMMAGLKSGLLKVNGPGEKGKWALAIPLNGMFDGLKITAPILPTEKQVYAVAGDSNTTVGFKVIGLGAPASGTVRAGSQVPDGVSVNPAQVNVEAQKTSFGSVRLTLSNIATDAVARPLELVFDDGSRTSKTLVDFIGLPSSLQFDSGERKDCGASNVRLSLTLWPSPDSRPQQEPRAGRVREAGPNGDHVLMTKQNNQQVEATKKNNPLDPLGPRPQEGPGEGRPNGHHAQMRKQSNQQVEATKKDNPEDLLGPMPQEYSFRGFNFDALSARNVMMVLESGGVKAFEQIFTLPARNLDLIQRSGPTNGIKLTLEQWAQVVQGPARFGCTLANDQGNAYGPLHWAPPTQ